MVNSISVLTLLTLCVVNSIRKCSSFSISAPDTAAAVAAKTKLPKVLCVGEALWDSLPTGMFLGGAPANVAVHLSELDSGSDNVATISCLGADRLGKETARRLKLRNVNTDFLQFDDNFATGMVIAEINSEGDASYSFDTPSAWDYLQFDKERHEDLIKGAEAIIFGSLCGRLNNDEGATSADTIYKFRQKAKPDTLVFDVNLRAPWYSREQIIKLARGDSSEENKLNSLALVKVNEDEISILEDWLIPNLEEKHENRPLEGVGLKKRCANLAKELDCNRICVTRGEKGAVLWCKTDTEPIFVSHDGFDAPESLDGSSDTVGAGDSFLAALIRSLFIEKESPEIALARGCGLGAYVASRKGAVPRHDEAPKHLSDIFSFKI